MKKPSCIAMNLAVFFEKRGKQKLHFFAPLQVRDLSPFLAPFLELKLRVISLPREIIEKTQTFFNYVFFHYFLFFLEIILQIIS
jgi:hypothetical protein